MQHDERQVPQLLSQCTDSLRIRTRTCGRLATTSSSAGIYVSRTPSNTSCCRVAPDMDMQPSAAVLRQAPARQIQTCVLVLNRQQDALWILLVRSGTGGAIKAVGTC